MYPEPNITQTYFLILYDKTRQKRDEHYLLVGIIMYANVLEWKTILSVSNLHYLTSFHQTRVMISNFIFFANALVYEFKACCIDFRKDTHHVGIFFLLLVYTLKNIIKPEL